MFRFYKGSTRKTECYKVVIGGYIFGISYETIVSVRGKKNGRVVNSWGPTTGKHLKELDAYDLPILSREEMEKLYEGAILDEAERILGTQRFRKVA